MFVTYCFCLLPEPCGRKGVALGKTRISVQIKHCGSAVKAKSFKSQWNTQEKKGKNGSCHFDPIHWPCFWSPDAARDLVGGRVGRTGRIACVSLQSFSAVSERRVWSIKTWYLSPHWRARSVSWAKEAASKFVCISKVTTTAALTPGGSN